MNVSVTSPLTVRVPPSSVVIGGIVAETSPVCEAAGVASGVWEETAGSATMTIAAPIVKATTPANPAPSTISDLNQSFIGESILGRWGR